MLPQVDCQLDPALPPRAELAWVKVIAGQIMITNKIIEIIMIVVIIIKRITRMLG